MKPRNKNFTSRKNSKKRKLLLPRINNTGPVDTVIQEITDEDGMLEDIKIEAVSTVESIGSGYIGATVVGMDTSGNNTNHHNMGGPSAHMNLDHNYSPYDFFKLMMSEDLRSGILQECINMRAEMEGAGSKGDL